jgi:hypothetical protein
MKTSEDVMKPGRYASGCCGSERSFDKREVYQRCPSCHSLCEWEFTAQAAEPVSKWNPKRLETNLSQLGDSYRPR